VSVGTVVLELVFGLVGECFFIEAELEAGEFG